MILYSPECVVGLVDFGIQIPSRHDKALNVYSHLARGDLSAWPQQAWLRRPSGGRIKRADLERVHSPDYVARLSRPGADGVDGVMRETYELVGENGAYHRYDPSQARFPFSVLMERILRAVSGTYECGLCALEIHGPQRSGFAFFLGGGMHHAMPACGSGFCVVNDICIALRKLQAEGRIATAWVIDVDAHKGDGTAVIAHGDPSIRTLSIHMGRGWPLDAPEYDERGQRNPSYTPSDVEIPVYDGEEHSYLARLEQGLDELSRFGRPDIAYVVDGADPYMHDELPSTALLRLTLEQLNARDRLIHGFLSDRGIPGAWITGGGYGARAWEVHASFLGPLMRERLAGA